MNERELKLSHGCAFVHGATDRTPTSTTPGLCRRTSLSTTSPTSARARRSRRSWSSSSSRTTWRCARDRSAGRVGRERDCWVARGRSSVPRRRLAGRRCRARSWPHGGERGGEREGRVSPCRRVAARALVMPRASPARRVTRRATRRQTAAEQQRCDSSLRDARPLCAARDRTLSQTNATRHHRSRPTRRDSSSSLL